MEKKQKIHGRSQPMGFKLSSVFAYFGWCYLGIGILTIRRGELAPVGWFGFGSTTNKSVSENF